MCVDSKMRFYLKLTKLYRGSKAPTFTLAVKRFDG